MKRAVIFSGGAFEKPDWVTLPKDAMILCADSGLRHARALGISPDWVLGDFDSSSEQPEGESVLLYPPETCRRCGICQNMGQLVRFAMHRTG